MAGSLLPWLLNGIQACWIIKPGSLKPRPQYEVPLGDAGAAWGTGLHRGGPRCSLTGLALGVCLEHLSTSLSTVEAWEWGGGASAGVKCWKDWTPASQPTLLTCSSKGTGQQRQLIGMEEEPKPIFSLCLKGHHTVQISCYLLPERQEIKWQVYPWGHPRPSGIAVLPWIVTGNLLCSHPVGRHGPLPTRRRGCQGGLFVGTVVVCFDGGGGWVWMLFS